MSANCTRVNIKPTAEFRRMYCTEYIFYCAAIGILQGNCHIFKYLENPNLNKVKFSLL